MRRVAGVVLMGGVLAGCTLGQDETRHGPGASGGTERVSLARRGRRTPC